MNFEAQVDEFRKNNNNIIYEYIKEKERITNKCYKLIKIVKITLKEKNLRVSKIFKTFYRFFLDE